MKKRICLLFLSLILVFSLLPAYGVFAKELYDRPFGFTNKAASDNSDQSENTGSSGASSLRWVLVNTSHTVADDRLNGNWNVTYSFEGDSDGTARFKRSGGYFQDERNYFSSDVYYECMNPPVPPAPGM